MKRCTIVFSWLLFVAVAGVPAAAQSPVIVRDSLGSMALKTTCLLLGCNVTEQLDGSAGNVFLVNSPANVPLETFLQTLLGHVGIVDAEPDLPLRLAQSQTFTAPSGLWDTTPVSYFGITVWS